jgi:threonine dehydratase
LFEYVKRSNRETGPAIVGVELARAADLSGLLERMSSSPAKCEQIDATSPMFRLVM